jgi:hypothetical protein
VSYELEDIAASKVGNLVFVDGLMEMYEEGDFFWVHDATAYPSCCEVCLEHKFLGHRRAVQEVRGGLEDGCGRDKRLRASMALWSSNTQQ